MNNDLNRLTFLETNAVKFNFRSTKSMSERWIVFPTQVGSIQSLTDWCDCLTRRRWNAVIFCAAASGMCLHNHPHTLIPALEQFNRHVQCCTWLPAKIARRLKVLFLHARWMCVCACVYMCHVSRLHSAHISLLCTHSHSFSSVRFSF